MFFAMRGRVNAGTHTEQSLAFRLGTACIASIFPALSMTQSHMGTNGYSRRYRGNNQSQRSEATVAKYFLMKFTIPHLDKRKTSLAPATKRAKMPKRNDHQRGAAIMKQGLLAFQYEQEKGSTGM